MCVLYEPTYPGLGEMVLAVAARPSHVAFTPTVCSCVRSAQLRGLPEDGRALWPFPDLPSPLRLTMCDFLPLCVISESWSEYEFGLSALRVHRG